MDLEGQFEEVTLSFQKMHSTIVHNSPYLHISLLSMNVNIAKLPYRNCMPGG